MIDKKKSVPVESTNAETSLDWLRAFERSNGRRLRVLHIGNIANNAYNNAKIQRTYGIEADVLCYDYYHVMATPEWEDGNLQTAVDTFLPDWWSTELRGFRRPEWFIQGPASLCIDYMVARSRGQKRLAKLRRWGLEGAYWDLLEDSAARTGSKRLASQPSRIRLFRILKSWKYKLLPYAVGSHSWSWTKFYSCPGRGLGKLKPRLKSYAASFDPWKTIAQRLLSLRGSLRNRVIVPLSVAESKYPLAIGPIFSLWRWGRKFSGDSATAGRRKTLVDPPEKQMDSTVSLLAVGRSLVLMASRTVFEIGLYILFLPVRLIIKSGEVHQEDINERKERADGLIAKFKQQELDVTEEVWKEFHFYLTSHVFRFQPILAKYDIVQGYSIDGIIPLSNEFPGFTAYEHGTLRDIPFANTWLGLVCRLTYRNAPSFFITNSDVMGAARQLGLKEESTCYLPHAFDDRKLDNFRQSNASIVPDRDLVHFFCPSRQHWRDQNPSLTKGSDLMLRAAANVAAEGHRFRLILVEWGIDIDASKKLIGELGLEPFVSWVAPMNKQSLWHQYCASHAVLDQFSLPALGGVGFETLALGRRLITKIDVEQLRLFFGCPPPVLPATNVVELTDSIRSVILDPDDKAETGKAGRQWIRDYHSAERIVSLQAEVYRALIEKGAEATSSYDNLCRSKDMPAGRNGLVDRSGGLPAIHQESGFSIQGRRS